MRSLYRSAKIGVIGYIDSSTFSVGFRESGIPRHTVAHIGPSAAALKPVIAHPGLIPASEVFSAAMADRFDVLFQALDLDQDGRLTPDELESAAIGLGWSWRDAPLYSTLHRLTVHAPLTAQTFAKAMSMVVDDRHGPFGRVLDGVPPPPPPASTARGDAEPSVPEPAADAASEDDLPAVADVLEQAAGAEVAETYRSMLGGLATVEAAPAQTALLVIDPQRSFTQGAWMRSIGPKGAPDVSPIQTAFQRAAVRFRRAPATVAAMLTRCSFPPDSYGWDTSFAEILPADQPYFVKPGNNALWPPSNGLRAWLEGLLDAGWDALVISGCTLNSCVRVSAIETQRLLGERLQVHVDLSLCGARLSNYRASEEFEGQSSVAAAVDEMQAADVVVAQRVLWE